MKTKLNSLLKASRFTRRKLAAFLAVSIFMTQVSYFPVSAAESTATAESTAVAESTAAEVETAAIIPPPTISESASAPELALPPQEEQQADSQPDNQQENPSENPAEIQTKNETEPRTEIQAENETIFQTEPETDPASEAESREVLYDNNAQASLSGISFTFSDLRDAAETDSKVLNTDDGKQAVYVFGSFLTCYNTQEAVKAFSKCVEYYDKDKLNLFAFDINPKTSKEQAANWLNGNKISESVAAGRTGYAALNSKANQFYDTCSEKTVGSSGGWIMPLIVYKGTNGEIYHTTGYQTESAICANIEAGGLKKLTELKPEALNAQYRTIAEIEKYMSASGVTGKDTIAYKTKPVTSGSYSAGELSEDTLNTALAILNQVRYIAGISYNVTLDDEYNKKTQAAALVNYVNNEISHYPVKPAGMPDELYQLGAEGAKSSNLSSSTGFRNFSDMISGQLSDSDTSNIDRLGHRRWLLNPTMQKTGFGAVTGKNGTQGAVYAIDNPFEETDIRVAWPAQNMPATYFAASDPWSVSMNEVIDKSTVKVTLTRDSDKKQWTFSDSKSDGYFNVDNGGYGRQGCIIFRPQNITAYADKDLFHVEIAYGTGSKLKYDVQFFKPFKSSPAPEPETKPSSEPETNPELKQFTITFDVNGGIAVKALNVYEGDAAKRPANPVREGCDFVEWQLDGAAYDFEKPVTKDITLTAIWAEYKQLAAPEASLKTGMELETGTRVSLMAQTPGALIYYTTDGSSPDTNSNLYKQAVVIDKNVIIEKKEIIDNKEIIVKTATIKALAVKEGYKDSKIAEFSYTVAEKGALWGDVAPEDIPDGGIDKIDENGIWIAGVNDAVYTGRAIMHEIRVYSGKTLLTERKDYTVSYKNNTKAADKADEKAPIVIIKGRGIYKDNKEINKTIPFTINKKNISENDVIADEITLLYTGKEKSVTPTLSYNGRKLSNQRDFNIINPEKYKDSGEYKITVKGEGNYTGERAVTLTVTKKTFISRASFARIDYITYNGGEQKPEVSLKYRKTLEQGIDYVIDSYENNIEIGTAYVIIRGIGDFTGIKRIPFKIVSPYKGGRYDIGNDAEKLIDVDMDAAVSYSKSQNTPMVKVSLDGKRLVQGKDYTVSYRDNRSAYAVSQKEASAVITGRGKYCGKIVKTFTINRTDIKDFALTANNRVYTGRKGYTTKLVLKDNEQKPLRAGADYEREILYTYKEETLLADGTERKAGAAVEDTDIIPEDTKITVTLTGKGSYTGTITGEYTVIPKKK